MCYADCRRVDDVVDVGGPGCGKTFFVNYLLRHLKTLNIRTICGAFSASAAANIMGAETMHSIGYFSPKTLGKNGKRYVRYRDITESISNKIGGVA